MARVGAKKTGEKKREGRNLLAGLTGMKAKARLGVARGSWAVARLVGLLWLPACAEGPVLMNEEFLTRQGEDERYMGGGCMAAGDGGSVGSGSMVGTAGSAGVASGFQYGYEANGNGVHFLFTDSGGAVLAERQYDEAFINSGRRDEVLVEHEGQTWRFVNWGAEECQPIREPDGD
jgi:hypothetical protein